jgi:ATP-dependent Lon protease
MAAAREGLKELIFPASNKADVERLPQYIKQDIKFHFVDEFTDVFRILYP